VNAKKAMREYAAFEVGPQLLFDEASNGRALLSRPVQERFELFTDDFVKKRLFGFVAFVLDKRASTRTERWGEEPTGSECRQAPSADRLRARPAPSDPAASHEMSRSSARRDRACPGVHYDHQDSWLNR
jgi:hypothetical protein